MRWTHQSNSHNPNHVMKKTCVYTQSRRTALTAIATGWAVIVLSAGAPGAEWQSADSGTQQTVYSQASQASPARTASSAFVPRWIVAPEPERPAARAARPVSHEETSHVQQAAAFTDATELEDAEVQLMPIVDPNASESSSDSGPEVIQPSLDTFDEGLIPTDQYEAYTPTPADGEYVDSGYADGGMVDYAGPACGDCGPAGCYAGPCDYYGGCCNPCIWPVLDRVWIRSDAMLWWVKGFDVPALVTTTSDVEPTPFESGALGDPNTSILFGDGRLNGDTSYSGGRIAFGYWFDPCRTFGIEASFFGLDQESTTYRALSNGTPVLARPFYDVESLASSSWPVSLAGFSQGSIEAEATTELLGTEVLFRRAITQACCTRVDLLMGYRFMRLDDSLRISQSSIALEGNNPVDAGSTLDLYDQFTTWNRFHGAEIGITSLTRRCRWTFETGLKVAFGSTHSTVDISGGSTFAVDGDAETSPTGLLAQASNIGRYSQRDFTMIPEIGVTVGYDLTCNLRFTFGYSLIYWSKVARPGQQIDTSLDLARAGVDGLPDIPPAGAENAVMPKFRFCTDDLWAQGMNFGLSYRF